MVKHLLTGLLLFISLSSSLGTFCLATDSVDGAMPGSEPEVREDVSASPVIDYEQHVREIAQKTAEDAKARKAQERLERAKVSSLKLVASTSTSVSTIKPVTDSPVAVSSNHKITATKTESSSVPGSGSNRPTTFSNVKSSAADAGVRVFKYKKDGTVMFADSAPYKIKYEVVIYNSCYACSIASNVNWHNTRLRLTEFSDTIDNAAKQYGVNPGFVRAIIHAESAFNPLARSRKGAMGLMQLMPGTAKDMGVTDLTNPEQNINGGVRYLAGLLQSFGGNETLAAAAYNAGKGAVTRHGGIPPYEETQTYVKRVKILSDRYKNHKQLAMQ